ncbi:MFS permease protein [Klebsiella michiganensis]|uniref:MFS permease protein n=1 Tax=Klebsiella michiganensis TaxID=1134687 RepID=A0A7H4N1J2_9ENTR|nr:MFS permease protein [Klebsiella michiganensis]
MGAALVTVSFALMFLLPALPPHGQLILIAISAVGFDLGLQSSLVAHQNLVYGLEPQARGRLNALLFTGVFIGMSLGSVLGSKLYVLAGWERRGDPRRRNRCDCPWDPPAGKRQGRIGAANRQIKSEPSGKKSRCAIPGRAAFLSSEQLKPCGEQTLSRESPAAAASRNRRQRRPPRPPSSAAGGTASSPATTPASGTSHPAAPLT